MQLSWTYHEDAHNRFVRSSAFEHNLFGKSCIIVDIEGSIYNTSLYDANTDKYIEDTIEYDVPVESLYKLNLYPKHLMCEQSEQSH